MTECRRTTAEDPGRGLGGGGANPVTPPSKKNSSVRNSPATDPAMSAILISTLSLSLAALVFAQDIHIPPYVKHCKGSDPNLIDCIINALHHLRPYLAKGIPEIEMPTVEPFRMDDLSLALTSGPNGYKITLKEMDIYGSSNFTVTKLKLGHNGSPFEAKIRIPKMNIEARYTSTGVLIILPASGNGTFSSVLGDILATVRGTVKEVTKNGKEHLFVEKLDVDLTIKDVRMTVKKIFNNNRILTEATNLFLRENGQEILRVMMPQLKTKLAAVFKRVANQLLNNVPTEVFYTES